MKTITKTAKIDQTKTDIKGRTIYVINDRHFMKCPTYKDNSQCVGYMSYSPFTKFCVSCKILHNKELRKLKRIDPK